MAEHHIETTETKQTLSDPQTMVADAGQVLRDRIAVRVATARKQRGIPRRVLSETSGVSPRYLAQIENGEGNTSILLLERVARALDLKVESLISTSAPLAEEASQIATLFDQASTSVQDQVRCLLASQDPRVLRAGRICLIGLRGAGKSTLGKLAGEVLRIPFVELNAEIEQQTGMPLAEVMALYGVEGFRALEADALDRVAKGHQRVILAVAGGIVGQEQVFASLLQRFHTVWLKASPGEHMQRVRAQGDLRPMHGNPAAMAHLNMLLETRSALYGQADAIVETSNRSVNSALNQLLSCIGSGHFLDAE